MDWPLSSSRQVESRHTHSPSLPSFSCSLALSLSLSVSVRRPGEDENNGKTQWGKRLSGSRNHQQYTVLSFFLSFFLRLYIYKYILCVCVLLETPPLYFFDLAPFFIVISVFKKQTKKACVSLSTLSALFYSTYKRWWAGGLFSFWCWAAALSWFRPFPLCFISSHLFFFKLQT